MRCHERLTAGGNALVVEVISPWCYLEAVLDACGYAGCIVTDE